jgi:hypothetical protein
MATTNFPIFLPTEQPSAPCVVLMTQHLHSRFVLLLKRKEVHSTEKVGSGDNNSDFHLQGILRSHIKRNADSHDWDFSWTSSVLHDICKDIRSNLATFATFPLLNNSIFPIHPVIRCFILEASAFQPVVRPSLNSKRPQVVNTIFGNYLCFS